MTTGKSIFLKAQWCISVGKDFSEFVLFMMVKPVCHVRLSAIDAEAVARLQPLYQFFHSLNAAALLLTIRMNDRL